MPQTLSSALEMSTSSVFLKMLLKTFSTHLGICMWSSLRVHPFSFQISQNLYIFQGKSTGPIPGHQRQTHKDKPSENLLCCSEMSTIDQNSKTKAPWSGLMLPSFIPATPGSAALGFPPPDHSTPTVTTGPHFHLLDHLRHTLWLLTGIQSY